jgi:hypothetical protein
LDPVPARVDAVSGPAVGVDDDLEEHLGSGGYGSVEWSPSFGRRIDVDGEGDECGEDVRDGEEEKGESEWEVEELHLEMDDGNVVALMSKT